MIERASRIYTKDEKQMNDLAKRMKDTLDLGGYIPNQNTMNDDYREMVRSIYEVNGHKCNSNEINLFCAWAASDTCAPYRFKDGGTFTMQAYEKEYAKRFLENN